VRLVSKHLSPVSASFSEVDRDSEGGCTGRDVDRSSTSEIVTSVDERPAFGVPSPACNGVINESGPCKDKEKKWSQMRAFGKTTDRDHWSVAWILALLVFESRDRHLRDSREHELVDTENDGRDTCTSNGRFLEDTFHAEIFCAE